MKKEALLIFAKNLVEGQVKTRLAASVGNEKAFSVYKQLLQHTVLITQDLPIDKIAFYTDFIEEEIWKNNFYKKKIQHGNSLGKRMENAFKCSFTAGYEKVIIIGTDCFELNAEIIMSAFANLNKYDVVIGPATDGGYYMLGMKKEYPFLFRNIKWSTDEVFSKSIALCTKNRLSFSLLPELSDIDEEKDLQRYEKQLYAKQDGL
jgi:rSAM/selenodomain-associated transferase 1